MPVTARLSKAFYDRLGEQVTNELVEWFNLVDATYRSDLRELNELNFARFEAKLDQGISELRAELVRRIDGIEGSVHRTLHRELRDQTRFMVGIMTALWMSLLIPIVGLWMR